MVAKNNAPECSYRIRKSLKSTAETIQFKVPSFFFNDRLR